MGLHQGFELNKYINTTVSKERERTAADIGNMEERKYTDYQLRRSVFETPILHHGDNSQRHVSTTSTNNDVLQIGEGERLVGELPDDKDR